MSAAPAPRDSNYRHYARTRPVKWWHTAIIDDMILYPTATHQERADRLGYTKQAITMLLNSDMFKAAYAARRADFEAKLDDDIRGKLTKTASLALDIMHQKLTEKRQSVAFKDLNEATTSLLDRLGYGAKTTPATAVQVNVNASAAPQISSDDLAEARARLREVEAARAADASSSASSSPLIDVTPSSTPSTEEA